jgi:glycosyltransferase involved in cell wall biosynthesis
MTSGSPLVSVILCTRNPEPGTLAWALDSLKSQTLSAECFEVIVVDNGSDPPLAAPEHGLNLRVIREPSAGLTIARCAGIAASSADLLVFQDDDNALAPSYLETALRMAAEHPRIGHFGGVAAAELPGPIPRWRRALLPYLGVRDHGPEPITSFDDPWGPSDPIGAGMVCRREVARAFVKFVSTVASAPALGRSGGTLASGEDTLFARLAQRLGYACSYQPGLRLLHRIPERRLRFPYLARLVEGHGRSCVRLERALGNPVRRMSVLRGLAALAASLPPNLWRNGLRAGLVSWFWHLGFVRESVAHSRGIHRE